MSDDLWLFRPGDCWIHGDEPLPDDYYRVCFECGHVWQEAELLEAYNRTQELFCLEAGEEWRPETDANKVYSCLFCSHDF